MFKDFQLPELKSSLMYGIVLESDLMVFSLLDRLISQAIFWPIVVVGLLGNGAVVWRILAVPGGRFSLLKPFYRCALLSFAFSDLLLLVASGSHVLAKLSTNTTKLWILPTWSCSIIPYLQTLAVLAGSLTLAAIAIDRYRALTAKYPNNERFEWPYGIVLNISIWFLAIAASYSVINLYEITEFIIIQNDGTIYMGNVCSTNQSETGFIYAALFIVIFVPLTLIFLVVHILLALNIWRRQQQQNNKSHVSAGNNSQNTEFSTVSSSTQERRAQAHQRPFTSNQVRRKKRTVRVILVLILVFLVGRLPSWLFLLYKQHVRLSGSFWEYLQTALTGLTLLNAALNPFLYSFLCETLSLLKFFKVCCAKKKRQDNVTTRIDEPNSQHHVNPVIVPRGPYNF